MCGIIGYIGPEDCVSLLVEGLRRLEYRGYDSAGVAVISEGAIQVRRCQGKLQQLELLLQESPVQGTVGSATPDGPPMDRPPIAMPTPIKLVRSPSSTTGSSRTMWL